MRHKSYGDDLYPELERLGVPKVLHMQSLNQFHILDRDRVSAWLKTEEAKAAERAEDRSEENLSISRKALRNSERATKIAISAIVLSIIMAIPLIIEFIQWLLKKIQP